MTFIARRLIAALVTLLAAAVIIFVMLELLPGDPAAVVLGVNATPETLAALRSDFGLDRPVLERFFRWLVGFATGDLGTSYTYRIPVAALIAERFAVTLPLAFLSILLAAAIGLPLGLFAAARANSASDTAVMVFAEIGLAVPSFWLAILLVLLFSVTLGWLPSGGFPGWDRGIVPGLKALVLPAISLALPQAAVLARIMRGAALEAMAEPWMRTARAKGLSLPETMRRHVFRNALIPVLTILGLQVSFLIAGAIVIENVFSLPGLGRLVFQAIGQHDIIVVKDLVMVFSAMVILVNFLVDVLYGLVDPRLARGRA